MLVTRTPLRISFFGGGSDIPAYYEKHGGYCLSTTIDQYVYIAVNYCVANHIRVIYSKLEQVDYLDQLEHDRFRETLREHGPWNNIEICSFSDIPTYGTGLGSSSAFTVGLINALTYDPEEDYKKLQSEKLAEAACKIEINKCKAPIGKQDQYAAAYGGFNAYVFSKNGQVLVDRHVGSQAIHDQLQENLMLFYTGTSRQADDILKAQVTDIKDNKVEVTQKLVILALEATDLLKYGEIDRFGQLLHDSWLLKRSLYGGVSNPVIDYMYDKAYNAGALGGKILGAGGGGYMLFYVPQARQNDVRTALVGYKELRVKFSYSGSKVVQI